MDISTPTVSPLRQRMLDDLRMRKMAQHTQDSYSRAVRKLVTFLGRSPDSATIEELRRFQLHLVDAGTDPVTINATITGLRFFSLGCQRRPAAGSAAPELLRAKVWRPIAREYPEKVATDDPVWAAIDPQQAAAEPKDRTSGDSRVSAEGLWEKKVHLFSYPLPCSLACTAPSRHLC